MDKGTPIGRVRGRGSAHAGTHHWLLQRFTSIGNLVLVPWLLFSLATMPNYDFATVAKWAHQPIHAWALGLLILNVFWHARLGLQVMIEDYVHDHANSFAAIALLNLATFAGAGFGLLCVIRLALGAA